VSPETNEAANLLQTVIEDMKSGGIRGHLSYLERALSLLQGSEGQPGAGGVDEAIKAIEAAEVECDRMVKAQWEGKPAMRFSIPAKAEDSDLLLNDAFVKARAALQAPKPTQGGEVKTRCDMCGGHGGFDQEPCPNCVGTGWILAAPRGAGAGAPGEPGEAPREWILTGDGDVSTLAVEGEVLGQGARVKVREVLPSKEAAPPPVSGPANGTQEGGAA